MLNLLFQLLAQLFITRPPRLEPGIQSHHARRALAELDSRFFRIALPRKPDTELGKLNRPSPLGKTRTREAVQPSRAEHANNDSFDWGCQ